MYRIVSAAGTVLARGYLTAPDARRALSHNASEEQGKASDSQLMGVAILGAPMEMPAVETTWRTAHIETDDDEAVKIVGVIPDNSGAAHYVHDAATIRRAQRRSDLYAGIALAATAALWAGIIYGFAVLIWGL